MKQPFDVIVIGAGMGGLVAASLLAKEGRKVCVLEKNRQLGGNLQVFARDKQLFDAGVHYLGSLAEGDNLYQLLNYLGIYDQLKLERMDRDAFDRILIGDDPIGYPIAQGYENFVKQLAAHFPEEEAGLRRYIDRITETCSRFPLYSLTQGDGSSKQGVMQDTAEDVIAQCVKNARLRAVLGGNNLLYAGDSRTPFYVHALIEDSYIRSAWKARDGGSQLAIQLSKVVRENGGSIINHCQIQKLVEEDGQIAYAIDSIGNRYYADNFISNVDPVATLAMTGSAQIRQLYRSRINSLQNTISSFSVHLVLKPAMIPYENCNYYFHREGMLWQQNDYTQLDWPRGYALFFTRSREHPDFAGSITIFTAMRYDECMPWEDSFNTVSKPQHRGHSYENFKEIKSRRLMSVLYERFPQLEAAVENIYSTSPLSYRDYIGTTDGNMYGFAKDAKDPLKTQLSPRTKIPNLYLTGQNLNLHGVLGSALSGLLTSSMLLNSPAIIQKIKDA